MSGELAVEVTSRLSGDWCGAYGLAPAPGHSKRDRSLSIRPHPSDPDDVILHSFAGEDWRAIKNDLRRGGILPAKDFQCPKRAAPPRRLESKSQEAAYKAGRRELAKTLWKRRQRADGTVVGAYFRWRGIEMSPLPGTLGYLPANPPRHGYPAMIAAFGLADEQEPGRVALEDGGVQGVHLTFLAPDGKGKAPIEKPRKMIGTCKGLPIVLAPPNDGLALCICEGIESALSAHQVGGVGAWAAASAAFMPALADVVPDYIETLIIAAEADPAGQRGAIQLAERVAARGFEVRITGATRGT
jgi:hypothetical protein